MITCPNCGRLTKEQIYIYNTELRKQNFGHTPILPTCKICNAEVAIYTFAGKLAAKGRAGEYTLPAGNYIVKAGGKAVKVTIR